MKRFEPKSYEKKWQDVWAETDIYAAKDFDETRQKYIMLTEFPYPSGDGLHLGHVREYTLGDIMARHKRMQGYNVMYPMGYDAFGLPTENYAIKNKITPQAATAKNIANFDKQFTSLGLSFDWSREITTSDPNYYRWTQWLFLQFFKNNMAYQEDTLINWCPTCKTGLANEEVVDGKHERCGTVVEKKKLKQWMLRITNYADRLIDGLKTVDFPSRIGDQQINWIGRSSGMKVRFAIDGHDDELEVFTTAHDTIFGVTFMVIAPEHELVDKLTTKDQKAKVEKYVKSAIAKSEVERKNTNREKTGVFTGSYAVNPVNNEKIPIWVADYVLVGYGTGAIMAVPGEDERDNEFATEFGLPIIYTTNDDKFNSYQDIKNNRKKFILANSGEFNGLNFADGRRAIADKLEEMGVGEEQVEYKLRDWIFSRQHYWGEPIPIIHCPLCVDKSKYSVTITYKKSNNFNQILSGDKKVFTRAENNDLAQLKVDDVIELKHENTSAYATIKKIKTYKDLNERFRDKDFLIKSMGRDFSSLADLEKYYEENTPSYLEKIKDTNIMAFEISVLTKSVAVPDDQLPVELPKVDNYEPTDTGKSPLAAITDWVSTTCPECGGPAKRETDTMPNWAGSSWYYLRYMDPHNDQAFADYKKLEYWGMVDLYLGGMEHTTLHLLYSRFWHEFFYDQDLVPTPEPYQARRGQGIVLAEDGSKMSKSKGNVVNPDDLINAGYGADSVRMAIAFLAPYDQTTPWNQNGVPGMYRYLNRVWDFVSDYIDASQKPIGPAVDNQDEHATRIIAELNKTIRDVSVDLDNMAFNTALAKQMKLSNSLRKIVAKLPFASDLELWRETIENMLIILAPFAPHFAEQLWQELGHDGSIHLTSWPVWDESKIADELITIVVQVNGKLKAEFDATTDITDEEMLEAAKSNAKIKGILDGAQIRKEIVVSQKLVNFVIS